jgi:hypothetical protein
MSEFAHHVALAVSVCALAVAGLRLAPGTGLARVVAAVAIAAAAAVAEAMLLGLVALGGSSVALTLAALATWLAVRLLRPAGAPLGMPALNPVTGAVAGLWGAWTVWLLLHPALGHDMVLYHLPEAIQWVHSGHPGAIDPIITGVPVGSYPLTHEVLLEWGLAIGRSFIWATIVTACAPLLIGLSGWLGLRTLGVDRIVSALAVAALISTPAVIASQSGGASLDPAALAWLVTCAALCACAVRGGSPSLLAPALVAAALAVGTKTTTGPLALTVLVVAAVLLRGPRLRAVLKPLLAAAGLGVVAGGFWYLRNTWQHGWPLWPFSSAPWGDARPPVIADADVKFIDRPGDTLDRVGDYYLHHVGGPLLLFCGAIAAALLARSRAVAFAALATLVSIFIWMNAPFTGVFGSSRAFDIGTGDATRYLLPGAAVAAVAIAVASKRGGWLRVGCALLLAAAALIGLKQSFDLGYPSVPSLGTPIAGAALGAVGLWLLSRVRLPGALLERRWLAGAAAVAVLVAGAAGALAADGFVQRHGDTATRESGLASWFALQPDWHDGSAPIASTWSLVGTLAGDRLQHPLVLVGALEACQRGRSAGWLVIDRAEARLRGAPGCGVAPGYSDHDYQSYARLP